MEVLIFSRAFGMERGWQELARGARIRIPRLYRPLIAWVMLFLVVGWGGVCGLVVFCLARLLPGDPPAGTGTRPPEGPA